MANDDFDRPPRNDIFPSADEQRAASRSVQVIAEELDGPDDLVLDETATTRARMPSVSWPTADKDAPDYAHLEPGGREPIVGDKRFTITGDDIERLIAANGFDPKGPNGRIVIAFRGAKLVDDEDDDNDGAVAGVDHVKLEETRPDHRNFRCVIGYYNRQTKKLAAYTASTVPNVKYMTNYYMVKNDLGGNSGTGANMLPTGCYVFRVGAHGNGSIYPALRLTDPEKLTEDGQATVLRTSNDLTFKTDDLFDKCTPYDHVHCAYADDSFSSAGCLTIQGANGEGPWGQFQATLKTLKANTRIDLVLLTGRDASIAAYLRTTGRASDSEFASRMLQRLRPGSTGDAVSRLQEKLGLKPSGYFGPGTKKALADHQRKNKLSTDGIWRSALDDELGWGILTPAAVPAPAAPAPAVAPAPAPTPAPAAAPVAAVAPAAAPALVAAAAPAASPAAAAAAPIVTASAAPAGPAAVTSSEEHVEEDLTRSPAALKQGDGAFWDDEFEQEADLTRGPTRGSDGWDRVHWPKEDKDSPEYRHLADSDLKGATFELTSADLDLLFKANSFEPLITSDKIIFALRGATLEASPGSADDKFRQVDRPALRLKETRPNHQHFRCTIGVYDTAKKTLSAYIASTVPCRQAVYGFVNGGDGSNMLPTGCYAYVCGPHKDRNGCLRENEDFTVLRSKKDYVFDLKDVWDKNFPADNLHPAFANSSAEFSSWGCQTIRGNHNKSDGSFSGEYRLFRQALGLKPGAGSHGTKFSYVMLTGLEAATAAAIRKRNPSGAEAEAVAKLGRLRHGSRGDRVKALQEKIGAKVTGTFDSATKKALAEFQIKALGWADGLHSPEMDGLLKLDVFAPKPPPQAATPAPTPSPAPAPAPAPVAAPAPAVAPAPVPAPAPVEVPVAAAPAPAPAAAAGAAAAASPAVTAALNQMMQGDGAGAAPVQVASAETRGRVALDQFASVRDTVPPPRAPASLTPALHRNREPGAQPPTAAPPAAAPPIAAPPVAAPVPPPAAQPAAAAVAKPGTEAVQVPRLLFTPQTVKAFGPRALPQYAEALLAGNEAMTRYGLNQTPLRFCHFLGQIGNECGRLTVLEENMNYRSAARIRAIWPSRFPTLASAESYVNNPQKLAEKVYGDRFDNRPGDGYRYRGRGFVQITGRSSYREMGRQLGIPLEEHPELALDPKHALAIACETWAGKAMSGERDMNKLADDNKLEALTYRINGGFTNIDDRREAFEEAWEIWSAGDAPVRQLEPDVLDRGDRGPRVDELNARLNGLGLFGSITSTPPTHVYNAATYKAVRALQAHAGLKETGVMNAETWAALDRALDRRAPTRGAGPQAPSLPSPRRDPVARRLSEIRAWSLALASLGIVFVVAYLFAVTNPTGNTPLWLPLLFAGAVFVAGLALWLAGRPEPHWDVKDGQARTRSAGQRPAASGPGDEEPVRCGINLD